MTWQQWNAAAPVIPGLTGIVNPAPAVNPTGMLPPGAQYTPEQWAQMQQQNWQQWAQWQQQYQQWHQQYGAEYQKSMTALSQQQAPVQSPMPNTSVPPPLPPEVKPPQPPEEPSIEERGYTTVSSQPNFSAPPPSFQPNNQNKGAPNQTHNQPPLNQQPPFNRNSNQNNRNYGGYQQNRSNQSKPPSLMSLSIKKPDFGQEVEPKRMKMELPSQGSTKVDATPPSDKPDTSPQNTRTDTDAQSNTPSEDLSETEKKFIKQFTEWEAQFNKWKEQNANHPDKEQYREYEKKWEAWRTQLLERREQMRRKRLALTDNQKAPGMNQSLNVNQPKVDNLNKPCPSDALESSEPEVKDDGSSFLKLSSSDGIPGLDLVGDASDKERLPSKDSPVIELDKSPDMLKKVGPDLEAISKGINSILGDQKLLSMLSMVSQNQKIQPSSSVTDTTSRIRDARGFEKEFAETSSQGGWSGHGDQKNFDNMSNYDEQSSSSFGGKQEQDWTNRDYNNYGNSKQPKGPVFRGRNQDNYRDPENFQGPGNVRGLNKTGGSLNFEPPDSFRASDNFQSSNNFRGQDNLPGSDDYHGADNFQGTDNFGGPDDFQSGNSFRRQGNMQSSDNSRGQGQFRGPNNFQGGEFRGPGSFKDQTNMQGQEGYYGSDNFRGQRDDFHGPDGMRGSGNFRGGNNFQGKDNFRGADSFKQNSFGNKNSFGGQDNFGSRGNFPQDNFRGNNFQGGQRFQPPGGTFQNRGDFGSSNFQNQFDDDQMGCDDEEYHEENYDNYDEEQGEYNDEFTDNYGNSGGPGRNFDDDDGGNGFDSQHYDEEYDENDVHEYKENYNSDMMDDGPAEDTKQEDEVSPIENIWQPVNVIEYDHKSQKQEEIRVSVEPLRTFDYRHKPVNRIPLPQRPDWLKKILRNYREFDFVISRYDQPSYGRYPSEHYDRYPDTSRYPDRNRDDRRRPDEYRGGKRTIDDVPSRDYDSRQTLPGRGKYEEPQKGKYEEPKRGRFEEPQRVKFEEPQRDDDQQRDRFEEPQRGKYEEEKGKYDDGSRGRYDESARGKFEEPQRGKFEESQKGKYSDLSKARYEEPQRGRYEEPNRPKYEEPQRGRFEEPQRGRFEETQRGRFEESQRGRFEEPQRGRFEDSQKVRFEEPQRGRFEETYRGRFEEPPPRGKFDEPHRARFEEPQRGRFEEPQRGRFEEPHRGRFEDTKDKEPIFGRDSGDFSKEMRHKESANRDMKDEKMSPPQTCPTKNITLIEDILNPPGRFSRPARIVIILRGPPGSGKTFLAKLIKDKEVENGGSAPRILSLDDYFMVEQEKEVEEDGKKSKIKVMEYEYDGSMEVVYRVSLFKAFKKTITDGYFTFIIVDNINDKVKYFGEMWSFAKQNGFQVYVCQLEFDLATCTKRNIHNRSEAEIQTIINGWEGTPSHHPSLDATSLVQSASIPEVEMEEINSPPSDDFDDESAEEKACGSKWDNFDCSLGNLAKLDGTSKPLRPSKTMEDYLQIDDEWVSRESKPGQKRVRWADLEERKKQQKMRAIGFVVGQTNWDRMMDPSMGSSALTQTKYIERVPRYYRN